MRDHDEQMRGSSSNDANSQPIANGGPHDAHASAEHDTQEEMSLSRIFGGPGISLAITVYGVHAKALADGRLFWGLPHGGDGYSLLPFEVNEGPGGAIVTFNVPAHALPGPYAVQLEVNPEFSRRMMFYVTTQEPPADSPLRQLRTEPSNGNARMYLIFDRYRQTPPRAAAEIAKLLKRYDTFFVPPANDPNFNEILDEKLTQDEKREKFATWLVKSQLRAENAA